MIFQSLLVGVEVEPSNEELPFFRGHGNEFESCGENTEDRGVQVGERWEDKARREKMERTENGHEQQNKVSPRRNQEGSPKRRISAAQPFGGRLRACPQHPSRHARHFVAQRRPRTSMRSLCAHRTRWRRSRGKKAPPLPRSSRPPRGHYRDQPQPKSLR